MSRAQLHVLAEWLPWLVLPPGFSEVWSRQSDAAEKVELTVEGPFPSDVADGARVGLKSNCVPAPGWRPEWWEWYSWPGLVAVGDRITSGPP